MNIPEKDLQIIQDVAAHIAYMNPIYGMDVEDIKQDMVIHGLKSYEKWDDDKHIQKGEARRDNNLRLFLKNYMSKRMINFYKALNTDARKSNLNVTSLNPGDPNYEILTQGVEAKPEDVLSLKEEDLNLNADQIKVLEYIGREGLKRNNISEMEEETGIGRKKIKDIVANLGKNHKLKEFLLDRV